MDEALQHIERLQARRGRRQVEASITPLIAAVADQARRTHRRHGQLIELWRSLLPERLADRSTITAVRGGVIHVQVDSSSVSFEIDRLLRDGVLDSLRRGAPGTIVRVRLKVGPAPR